MSAPAGTSSRLGIVGLLLIALAIYLGGLGGGFLFDDFRNIVDNDVLRMDDGSWAGLYRAGFSGEAGPLGRPISMASFVLNLRLTGMDAASFKLFNVLIHLLNGLLLYQLARMMIPRLLPQNATAAIGRLPALLTAGIWLLHPLHVSNVLYVVQRMNLLAVLFLLAALLAYGNARLRMIKDQRGWLAGFLGFALFTLLAVYSKENGALALPLAAVMELFVFRLAAARPLAQRAVVATWGLALAVGLAGSIYLLLHPDWVLGGYSAREFDLTQRLLTQARVLWHYLLWTFLPNPHWMGLFHDDIPISSGLLQPASTLPALLGLATLAALAVVLRRRQPGVAFAIAWFFVAHALESSVFALEMVFEHRQYLPMAGVFIGLAASIAPTLTTRPRASMGVTLALFGGLALLTGLRAHVWNQPLRLLLTMAHDHPGSSRGVYEAGRALAAQGSSGNAASPAALLLARPYYVSAMALSERENQIHSAVGLLMTYQHEPRLPDGLVQELAERLRANRQLDVPPLIQVLKAAGGKALPLTPTDIQTLVEAALDNPHNNDWQRGMVLTNYGEYLAKATADRGAAISATLAAVQYQPDNPLFQLKAAQLAERFGEPAVARHHLQLAERLDEAQLYAAETAALSAKLNAASPP